jgi:hypothetical protein
LKCRLPTLTQNENSIGIRDSYFSQILTSLREVEQEIKAFTKSEEYKLLAKKNGAWSRPKPTDEEKADWELLQVQLRELKDHKKFWQDVILSSTASYVRKQDSVRKEYKKRSAPKSAIELLTKVADHLYSIYKFETKFDDATFGDVMEATQFKNRRAIIDHFSNNNKNANIGDRDMKDYFIEDDWIFLLELNFLTNAALHSSFTQSDDKITIVLPSPAFKPKNVQRLMEQMGIDAAQLEFGYQEC